MVSPGGVITGYTYIYIFIYKVHTLYRIQRIYRGYRRTVELDRGYRNVVP